MSGGRWGLSRPSLWRSGGGVVSASAVIGGVQFWGCPPAPRGDDPYSVGSSPIFGGQSLVLAFFLEKMVRAATMPTDLNSKFRDLF